MRRCKEEGVSRSVQRAFTSMLGEGEEEEDEEDKGGEDEEQTETLSAEIELNRENKKMLKVRVWPENCKSVCLPVSLELRCEEEGMSLSVQSAFTSMLGEGEEEEDEEDEGEEDEEQTETLSAEIELNRENKKMLKVRVWPENCKSVCLPVSLELRCKEEGVSRSVQRAFTSMLGEGEEEEDEEDKGGEDEEQTETLSAEIELKNICRLEEPVFKQVLSCCLWLYPSQVALDSKSPDYAGLQRSLCPPPLAVPPSTILDSETRLVWESLAQDLIISWDIKEEVDATDWIGLYHIGECAVTDASVVYSRSLLAQLKPVNAHTEASPNHAILTQYPTG
ncbi:UNVERIFIED_CONTAM: hypothetical protein FKN15_007403 [Acipenser sinensis]